MCSFLLEELCITVNKGDNSEQWQMFTRWYQNSQVKPKLQQNKLEKAHSPLKSTVDRKHDYLVAVKRQQSFRLTAPPIPTTPRTFYQSQLPDFDTPTSDKRPDTPVTSSIQPVMSLILPTTPTAPTSTRSTNSRTFCIVKESYEKVNWKGQKLYSVLCEMAMKKTDNDNIKVLENCVKRLVHYMKGFRNARKYESYNNLVQAELRFPKSRPQLIKMKSVSNEQKLIKHLQYNIVQLKTKIAYQNTSSCSKRCSFRLIL
ncbi:unnamed protein product [Mytilus edulis]|uniref:Uncharacterized protein n=1 Tax=Mytilus edulis TaxID=6550 RepID=A0A8S3Q6F7_MYTED|nr:unnamed protein product [Mytilus edulis]